MNVQSLDALLSLILSGPVIQVDHSAHCVQLSKLIIQHALCPFIQDDYSACFESDHSACFTSSYPIWSFSMLCTQLYPLIIHHACVQLSHLIIKHVLCPLSGLLIQHVLCPVIPFDYSPCLCPVIPFDYSSKLCVQLSHLIIQACFVSRYTIWSFSMLCVQLFHLIIQHALCPVIPINHHILCSVIQADHSACLIVFSILNDHSKLFLYPVTSDYSSWSFNMLCIQWDPFLTSNNSASFVSTYPM